MLCCQTTAREARGLLATHVQRDTDNETAGRRPGAGRVWKPGGAGPGQPRSRFKRGELTAQRSDGTHGCPWSCTTDEAGPEVTRCRPAASGSAGGVQGGGYTEGIHVLVNPIQVLEGAEFPDMGFVQIGTGQSLVAAGWRP